MTIVLTLYCTFMFILLAFNTALLLALCGSITKLFEQEPVAKAPIPQKPSYLSDVPIPRPPNYSDLLLSQKPSTDLRFLRDE
jgi:hypothetical protein